MSLNDIINDNKTQNGYLMYGVMKTNDFSSMLAYSFTFSVAISKFIHNFECWCKDTRHRKLQKEEEMKKEHRTKSIVIETRQRNGKQT